MYLQFYGDQYNVGIWFQGSMVTGSIHTGWESSPRSPGNIWAPSIGPP
jgi:hypothetical protein